MKKKAPQKQKGAASKNRQTGRTNADETNEPGSSWDESVRELSKRSQPSVKLPPDENDIPSNSKGRLFTPGEIGEPDADEKADGNNPQGVQGGRGPLDQEGEGNRQSDEIAELEQDIDPAKDLDERRN
jgi:hypothetical protein